MRVDGKGGEIGRSKCSRIEGKDGRLRKDRALANLRIIYRNKEFVKKLVIKKLKKKSTTFQKISNALQSMRLDHG
jgi:hypothetical protein